MRVSTSLFLCILCASCAKQAPIDVEAQMNPIAGQYVRLALLQRNFVALVSIVIAVSSLSYYTWRNEKSEYNRNQRLASLQLILKLGELQELVFHSHYDRDVLDKGAPRTGWALVLTVRDLAQVLEAPLPESATNLVTVWGERWNDLGEEQRSADAILEGIESVRDDTLGLLRNLD